MKTFIGIAATDEVNRYNEVFSLQAMYSAYEKQWDELMPSFANHNHTRSIGFSKLGSIYLEPGKAYITNSLSLADSREEYKKIRAYNHHHLYETCVLPNTIKYNTLLEKLNTKIIGEVKKCWINGVSIYNKGIVERVFPELTRSIQNGLLDLSCLSPVLPGVYKIDDYLIFAHRYFRRGYSYLNTLNTPFLSRLEDLSHIFSNVKIAIDLDCIGLAGTEHKEYEYQYWWGPKFKDDLNSIPFGVTKHENEHYSEAFSDIRSTEFGWYLQDDKHTFECEEITDIPNIKINDEEMYACRFVHSMVDSLSNKPIHLDGAIRAYSDDAMIKRLDESIKESDRNQYYTKLWRIDGSIPIDKWKELITHYYRDNMLVGEYFGGEDNNLSRTRECSNVSEISPVSIKGFIPCNLNRGDGIRINFSFSKRSQISSDYDVIINPLGCYRQGDSCCDYIESGTMLLYKHLYRNGIKVSIPHVKLISFFDLVTNFPIIECKNITVAKRVIESLECLCNNWNKNGDDRIMSFSIKIPYDNRAGTYSFIGHIDDFLTFFTDWFDGIPQERGIYKWLSSTYEYIASKFNHSCTVHPMDVMETNEMLSIRRSFVPAQNIETFDSSGNVKLNLTKDEWEAIIQNNISPVIVLEIEKSICSKCRTDFSTCNCISLIDDGVVEIIKKAKPVGLVWTNRSAFLK